MNPKKILFLGTHGQENIGDDLLMLTFLERLGAQHEYFINSYDPQATRSRLADRFQVEVFHTTRQPVHLLKYILQCDLVVFGGGNIIKELYPTIGRPRYLTLLMVLAIVTLTNLLTRTQIILSNIGIGQVDTPLGRWMAKAILAQASLVALRDRHSYHLCQTFGIQSNKLFLVPDAAFLNARQTTRSIPARTPAGQPLRIGLNLNYDIENTAHWETFLRDLQTGLEKIQDVIPVEIHAIPMQSAFNPNHDYKILDQFRRQLPHIPFQMHKPAEPQDVLAILAGCDLVVAERLHVLILAALSGVPSIPLMYDIKVRQLARQLGLQSLAIDINRPFSPDRLLQAAQLILERYNTLSRKLQTRSMMFKEHLEVYFRFLDRQFLGS